jgi:virulence-associated protein VagC
VRLDEQVQLLAHGSKLLLQPAQKSWDSTQEL